MEEEKTEYYFWDEMWNDKSKQQTNEDEKNITENQLEDNEDEPQV